MGAILSVNLLKNSIGSDYADYFVGILKDHPTLKSLCGNNSNETELDMGCKMHGVGDAIMLIAEVVDNVATTSLNLASNSLGGLVLPAGWTKDWMYVQFEGYGYKHTDGREQKDPPEGSKAEGIIAIANAIPSMGAMTKFDISSNDIRAEGGKALAAGLKGNPMITELNISSNRLGQNSAYDNDTSGVIALVDAIPDMRVMTSLNLASNGLGVEGAKLITAVLPMCT
jgi:hypothetical protein